MPLAGSSPDARLDAHLKWAARYARQQKGEKAAAHIDSALKYAASSVRRSQHSPRFGVDEAKRRKTEDTSGILSRLVELSKTASSKDPEHKALADNARDRIDSAKGLLRDSLARATVGTGETREKMYDDPDKLADMVIAKLKSGPYEPIEDKLGEKVGEFIGFNPKRRDESKYGPLCLWDVSAIKNFEAVCSTLLFNSDLYWNTSSATEMSFMFKDNTEFKGDLSTWDVSKVLGMSYMFKGAGIVDSGIGNWNTGSMDSARGMFQDAKNLSQDLDLSKWNTSKCERMRRMFQESAIINSGIGNWDVRKADTRYMLKGTYFTGSLDNWDQDKKDRACEGIKSAPQAGPASAVD